MKPAETPTIAAASGTEVRGTGVSVQEEPITPAPTPAPILTTMTEAVEAGAKSIDVASTVGMAVGDAVQIGDETNVIAGIGSLLLKDPLKKSHPAGTTITVTPAATPAATPAPAPVAPVAPDALDPTPFAPVTTAAPEDSSSHWMYLLIGIGVLAGFVLLVVGAFLMFTKSGKKTS
jgi:hypothetical protein